MTCPFCSISPDRIIFDNNDFFVIKDGFPVTEQHSLIITKQHGLLLSDMSDEQLLNMHQAVKALKIRILDSDSSVTGFNIGINEGGDAGQTVMHFHCHIIPRRKGDMQNPRGGVRGVIPEKQKY